MGQFISYLKARRIISTGYVYHLVPVKDLSFEALTHELVLLVNEFPEVFREDLPRVPPQRKIDIRIDLFLDTLPISTLPYIMATNELKLYKEQLKVLLNTGLI